ncbi:hypothetical protein HS041_12075 [Planomonospora sp. ID67723]|uniref:hypothetical protein n=1 Tax=Planomonospora sp. ID67723 TaxID=2738134 RepID=UPI0018C3C8AE|nr:hypothetical protein [Planomonospora sp. ID67723]MBG0828505.1 hypothetical protein [Planomonospora sp. ID67723]
MASYPDHVGTAQKLLEQQAEINQLRAEVERLTEITRRDTAGFEALGRENAALRAKLAKVSDIHSEFKIYDDCGHHTHDDDADTVIVDDLGEVCRSAYMYSICRECCAPGDSQTVDCVDSHDHSECWPCVTRATVDELPRESS